MRVDAVTLFPEMIDRPLSESIVGRARTEGFLELGFVNPRDFTEDRHRTVDDKPYGGGTGMVMMAEPLAACLEAIRAERGQDRHVAPLVLFSPIGQTLQHTVVQKWADSAGAVLLCGRYEGVDQRFIDQFVDQQMSLGDFVMSGGEIAAMALLDAVTRLQPGVLHDGDSSQMDSFHPALDGLLDCPHFTRPDQWLGQGVPEALMSGHHAQIETWRRAQRLAQTQRLRPDLIDAARAAGLLNAQDEAVLKG